MVSGGAVLAVPTADPAEDGDTVVELQFDAGAHVSDNPGRVVAQDEGQGHAVVTAVVSDLQVERAVDGYSVNPDENLTGARGGSRNVLPPQHVRAPKRPDDDGFQLCSFT